MRSIGIYLAAGESKRMGNDKRFLLLNEQPLGSIVFKNALLSKIDHLVVVTRISDSLEWLPSFVFSAPYSCKWSQIECAEASKGQGHSLKSGVKKAIEIGADAVIILLADQPFVTTEVINTLLNSYQNEPNYFFFAAANDILPMPPILFSKICFPYLLQLNGDQGLRTVIREKLFNSGKMIAFQDEMLFFDIDTVEDYEILQNHEHERGE
ncbi:NTP transferase domain-containing protein [Bacillus sp. RG28]|uniref:NTP transferase domain-containing protein n=1 Tax=Gottfriedia endophytica TaxID=2820819 RepID=A0A940NTW1_9BACI|nr:NTP transferase domain-containing protein [Gottfriedia endophytica]MBP0726686.1 NTP transferase domain-containing protein [Gottfriedia endophytica]